MALDKASLDLGRSFRSLASWLSRSTEASQSHWGSCASLVALHHKYSLRGIQKLRQLLCHVGLLYCWHSFLELVRVSAPPIRISPWQSCIRALYESSLRDQYWPASLQVQYLPGNRKGGWMLIRYRRHWLRSYLRLHTLIATVEVQANATKGGTYAIDGLH